MVLHNLCCNKYFSDTQQLNITVYMYEKMGGVRYSALEAASKVASHE